METDQILFGDNVEVLKTFPNECVDLVVTSPPYDCYDNKTEVLTENGWKLLKDVNILEKILTINSGSKKISWEKCTNKMKYDFNGELISFKNEYIDLLVTPNHKIYVEKNDGSPITSIRSKKMTFNTPTRLIKAENITSSHRIPLSGFKWIGTDQSVFILPRWEGLFNKKHKILPEIEIDLNYWLAFFGIWIADGSVRGGLNNFQGDKRKQRCI